MKITQSQVQRRRRSAGLTLVEMLLAMAGIGLVGSAIASMLVAVAYGTESSRDLRTLVVRHKIVESRLTSAIRSGRMILHHDANHLLIWTDDIDRNQEPGIAEIRLVRLDVANGTLAAWQVDLVGKTDQQILAINTSIPFDSNFQSVIEDFLERDDVVEGLWLDSVETVAYSMDRVNPQQGALVAYRVTLRTGDITNTVIGTAAMRNR